MTNNLHIAKLKKNARLLLFADFGIPVEKAKLYLNDMEARPDKVADYDRLLTQHLSSQFESVKESTSEELKAMAKERSVAWGREIGSVSVHEFVTMSKQWDIPIDGIIDQKITPELIKEILDFFVIGQEKYKIKLSVAFYTYYMHGQRAGLFLPKSNLLVCGPSGSGKTYGMQVLSKLFHLPFVIIHCNSLVQEGIVGPGLTDGFTSLMVQGWTKEGLERSVVCFDEFDKLFEKSGSGNSGTYNARVVNEMLNIIDDKGEVEFKQNFDNRDSNRVKVPSRKMMFVFTGVFNGLRKPVRITSQIAQTPVQKRAIGFRRHKEEEANTVVKVESEVNIDADNEPTIDDFIEFGVKPEILGRIQNFVFLEELTEEEMMALFDLGPYSPFSEFEQYFALNGIETILTEEGKRTLAEIACRKKLGVRGLKSLLQQVLMEDMYDLDVGEDSVLRVTREYIIDNLNG